MEILKKLFCFNDDDSGIIGLCKFNEKFYRETENKETAKKNLLKNQTLSDILKKPF